MTKAKTKEPIDIFVDKSIKPHAKQVPVKCAPRQFLQPYLESAPVGRREQSSDKWRNGQKTVVEQSSGESSVDISGLRLGRFADVKPGWREERGWVAVS